MIGYYIIIKGLEKLNNEERQSLQVLLEELMINNEITISGDFLVAIEFNDKHLSWLEFISTTNANFMSNLMLYESIVFNSYKLLLNHLKEQQTKEIFIHTYNNDKILFYDRLKQEITEDKKKELFKTLYNDKEFLRSIKIFLEHNQNKSKAAKAANLHRNSLENRLEKFYRVTGYDVRNFDDASFIYLFLKDE